MLVSSCITLVFLSPTALLENPKRQSVIQKTNIFTKLIFLWQSKLLENIIVEAKD